MQTSTSLSGQKVRLESIIFENPNFAEEWRKSLDGNHPSQRTIEVTVPPGHRTGGVPQLTYLDYRAGLDSACADVVIATILENGNPAVLGLRRSYAPYQGMWYMPGGAIFAYQAISEFLSGKVERETGQVMTPDVFLGVYRNNAEDFICSVTAVCYASLLPVNAIRQTKPADGHDAWRLFSAQDLDSLPPEEKHWYPIHVWHKCLQVMKYQLF